MSTFTQLLAIMRRDVVSESSGAGGFDDTNDLLPMLYQASAQIAAMLEFPVLSNSDTTLAEDATSFPIPGDLSWPRTLTLYGDELEQVPLATVLRKRGLPGGPRCYAIDPRKGGVVEFAPSVKATVPAGALVLEYITSIDPSALAPGDGAWSGRFADFHWIIPLRAGSAAWDSVGESERAQYFDQRFMAGLQMFAARLGLTNVANLVVEREQRNDMGSRLG